jgi:hypothetical protein
MRDLLVVCADVGSIARKRFAWATNESGGAPEEHRGEILGLVACVGDALGAGRPVALGFECPLAVPVPDAHAELGRGRQGEGNRPWSAGAGASSMATGVAQASWVLAAIRRRHSGVRLYLDWHPFAAARKGLLLWEAFVSASAKAASHHGDAVVAVDLFLSRLPDPSAKATVVAKRPLSLAGAAALWVGWTDDARAVHQAPLVLRA